MDWALKNIGSLADLVAIVALPLVFWQLWAANQARAVQDLVVVQCAIGDRLSSLTTASTPELQQLCFENLLNLLESVAKLINERSISRRKMWIRYLASMIDLFADDPRYRSWMSSARSSPRTFSELRKFAHDHAKLFVRDDVVKQALGWVSSP